MYLAFLEFLGTTELIVILFAALLLFGPRRLPQMSRQLGRSLSDFKRASEDFKRTWEKEVDLEKLEEEGRIARSMLSIEPVAVSSAAPDEPLLERGAEDDGAISSSSTVEPTIARTTTTATDAAPVERDAPATDEPDSEPSSSRKRDWL